MCGVDFLPSNQIFFEIHSKGCPTIDDYDGRDACINQEEEQQKVLVQCQLITQKFEKFSFKNCYFL